MELDQISSETATSDHPLNEWREFPSFRRRLRSDGIVETIITSPLSPRETTECVHHLNDYAVNNRLFEIVRSDHDAIFDASTRHSYETIEAALLVLGSLEFAYVAFIAPNDVTFGMCRQLAMRIDAPGVSLQVFRDGDSAESWLAANR